MTQKFRWGNELGPTGNGQFTNFEDFQAYTGQEPNGIFADPMWENPDASNFRLQEGSPCIDSGVLLPGFNDANSPWPYWGSAPDIGAFESASGGPPGPLYHLSGLLISPSIVDAGDSVTISVEVTNSGGMEGSYVVTLMIDGAEETSYELTLGPGVSDTVTFTVSREEAGAYEATVDGLSGSFTVAAAVFSWAFLGGIVGGVLAALAAAIALYLVLRRRMMG